MEEGKNRESVYDYVRSIHKQISEEMLMLKSLLPYLNNSDSYDNLNRVMEFFRGRVIAHFEWEETEVFPVALAVGDLNFKKIIRDLQQQHIVIIGQFDILNDIILKYGFSFVDDKVKDEFIKVSREMIEIMLRHSRKEDTEFYPFLEAKDIRITEIK